MHKYAKYSYFVNIEFGLSRDEKYDILVVVVTETVNFESYFCGRFRV